MSTNEASMDVISIVGTREALERIFPWVAARIEEAGTQSQDQDQDQGSGPEDPKS